MNDQFFRIKQNNQQALDFETTVEGNQILITNFFSGNLCVLIVERRIQT